MSPHHTSNTRPIISSNQTVWFLAVPSPKNQTQVQITLQTCCCIQPNDMRLVRGWSPMWHLGFFGFSFKFLFFAVCALPFTVMFTVMELRTTQQNTQNTKPVSGTCHH